MNITYRGQLYTVHTEVDVSRLVDSRLTGSDQPARPTACREPRQRIPVFGPARQGALNTAHRPQQGVYTVAQVCERLSIPKRSFYTLLKKGQLPMCEELQPRIGRIVRFRAEPIDRYIAGQFFGSEQWRRRRSR
jgi:excisionase family DNA binding protein